MVNKESTGPSLALFGILSALYILWAIAGAWYRHYFELSLSPTAWATVLEGVFSPLAFLWLLYAALSQRAELALQRSELQQNNETQRDQQQQMRRQADAMEAQIDALIAQSDAQYEPVLVLVAQYESEALITLQNLGGGLLAVQCTEGGSLSSIKTEDDSTFRTIHANRLAFWPTGAQARIRLILDQGLESEPVFQICFTRIDSEPVLHMYKWSPQEQQIHLKTTKKLRTSTERAFGRLARTWPH